MRIQPDLDSFAAGYEAGKPQVVWTSLIADLETPVSAMLKLAAGSPDSFLLESVEGGAVRGRYSFIGLKPDLIWRCHGDRAEISRNGAFVPCPGAALESLRGLIRDSRIDIPAGLPPFAAGLCGYMGFETVRLMERLVPAKPDRLGVPDGMFMRPTIICAFDNIADRVTLITPARPEAGLSAALAYEQAAARLAAVIADFDRSLPHGTRAMALPDMPRAEANMTREEFHRMVETAKDYIRAGDIFQVVLSQRFELPFALPPFALYRALRRINPSPFLTYLNFADFAVVASSPEILVRLRDGTVTIRPIAGTRPRGETAAEDRALEADLLADPKELAEHLMLLDLGRNDVGRVAEVGSVAVTDRMIIERYSHVMHIVSNVEGRLGAGADAMDALIAGFPAGTVSGAPKVRAMEIIDELERDRRGLYGGCMGYFSADGSMDTCIALRTAVVKDGRMYVQAGGGIVADSDPEAEYQESRNKARALVRAAEEAVRLVTGNW